MTSGGDDDINDECSCIYHADTGADVCVTKKVTATMALASIVRKRVRISLSIVAKMMSGFEHGAQNDDDGDGDNFGAAAGGCCGGAAALGTYCCRCTCW